MTMSLELVYLDQRRSLTLLFDFNDPLSSARELGRLLFR